MRLLLHKAFTNVTKSREFGYFHLKRTYLRNSLDEQAYMNGLMQLLKYPSQNAKLNGTDRSHVWHAASVQS